MEKIKKEKKQKLRVKDLIQLPPNKIFAGGKAFLMLSHGMGLARWIAIRGGSPTWTILYGSPDLSESEIRQSGIRLTDVEDIQTLVHCTPSTFERYRFY